MTGPYVFSQTIKDQETRENLAEILLERLSMCGLRGSSRQKKIY